jgi:2-dehydro-3-deoxygalactonokinase
MHLERLLQPDQPAMTRERLFETALQEVCEPWLREEPGLPIIACGMVGSTVGWREAAYLAAPVGTDELAGALRQVPRSGKTTLYIVPGISVAGVPGESLPEIMRGEETQIAGIVSRGSQYERTDSEDLLIGLPGTHAKWVLVRKGKIVTFSTFVTGELFGWLTSHSVIAKGEKKTTAFAAEAFQAGMEVARAQMAEGAGGVLSTIFSARARHVLGELKQEHQPDYLSGLLIMEELLGVERIVRRGRLNPRQFPRIVLAGEAALCARYKWACEQFPWPIVETIEGAAERGLWNVARAAKLVG